MPEGLRCAALYRVSTQRQLKDEDDAIPVQKAAAERFASERGWHIVREFSEEGVSAYRNSSDDRDVLQEVFRSAARREFEALLVFKADRLSRQAFEYPLIIAQFRKAGIRVFSVADGRELDTEGQMEKLLRFIEGWQAETESYHTSVRVSHAMRLMAERGEWTGGRPPYGYRLERTPEGRTKVVVNEDEARVVRMAVGWYLDEGLGLQRICRRLDAMGIRTRHGKLWNPMVLRRVLMNPVLCGRLAYGKTKLIRPGSKRRTFVRVDELGTIIVGPKDSSLEIIPEERWQALQEAMHGKEPTGRGSRPRKRRHLLTGILVCGRCGGPMFGKTERKRKRLARGGVATYEYTYYHCFNRVVKGVSACDGQRMYGASRLERVVVGAVRQQVGELDTEEALREVRQRVERALFTKTAREPVVVQKLEEAKRLRKAWIDRLEQHLANPEGSLYSEATIAERIREHETRIAELSEELRRIRESRESAAAALEAAGRVLEAIRSQVSDIGSLPEDDLARVLREIIDRVEVDRDRIVIRYRVRVDALGRSHDLEWTDTRHLAKAT